MSNIIIAVVVLLVLFLVYWYRNNYDMGVIGSIGNMGVGKAGTSGFAQAPSYAGYVEDLHFGNKGISPVRVGYTKSASIIEGFEGRDDGSPMESLSDMNVALNNDGSLRYGNMLIHDSAVDQYVKFGNANLSKWSTDMNIPIDRRNATIEDSMKDSLMWGNGLLNNASSWASISSMTNQSAQHISHGNDVLTLTDYSPEFKPEIGINVSNERRYDILTM